MPQTAKIFMNGRSQAVRLPVEFRFSVREVFIERQGDAVIIRPKPLDWDDFFARPSQVPEDFMADRKDLTPEKREHGVIGNGRLIDSGTRIRTSANDDRR